MSITIIGAGVMGETILSGLLRSGISPDEIVIAERRADRAAELTKQYAVECCDVAPSVSGATTVLLVVKPADVAGVLTEISSGISADSLIISLAAGITTSFMEQHLPAGTAVARVMPNTPALLEQGMSVISPGSNCTAEHLAQAERLLGTVGRVLVVPESDQDAVTAISGSGPAYIFYIAEAMIAAGESLGISHDVSVELVTQTIFGAATMLRETEVSPEILRQRVSSPGGTTVAAIDTLDAQGVREAFEKAMHAARNRSKELGAS